MDGLYMVETVVCGNCGAPRRPHVSDECPYCEELDGVKVWSPVLYAGHLPNGILIVDATDKQLRIWSDIATSTKNVDLLSVVTDEIRRRAELGDLAAWYKGAESPILINIGRLIARMTLRV